MGEIDEENHVSSNAHRFTLIYSEQRQKQFKKPTTYFTYPLMKGKVKQLRIPAHIKLTAYFRKMPNGPKESMVIPSLWMEIRGIG